MCKGVRVCVCVYVCVCVCVFMGLFVRTRVCVCLYIPSTFHRALDSHTTCVCVFLHVDQQTVRDVWHSRAVGRDTERDAQWGTRVFDGQSRYDLFLDQLQKGERVKGTRLRIEREFKRSCPHIVDGPV
jgi:hypothetical protein